MFHNMCRIIRVTAGIAITMFVLTEFSYPDDLLKSVKN